MPFPFVNQHGFEPPSFSTPKVKPATFVDKFLLSMATMNLNWPKDVTIYQPYPEEQILLPEQASCIAVKTYLKMWKLPFIDVNRSNAEHMSPGGRLTKLPIIRIGSLVLAEFENIATLIERELLIRFLKEEDYEEMRVLMSSFETSFTLAEMFVCFKLPNVYNNVTSQRIRVAYPWPISAWECYKKRNRVLGLLRAYQWHELTLDDVLKKVDDCCIMLAFRLNEQAKPFLYGDKPCELDALVFGHLFTILSTRLPNMSLATVIHKHSILVKYCQDIEKRFYKEYFMEEKSANNFKCPFVYNKGVDV